VGQTLQFQRQETLEEQEGVRIAGACRVAATDRLQVRYG
jgi:hypothetical protein